MFYPFICSLTLPLNQNLQASSVLCSQVMMILLIYDWWCSFNGRKINKTLKFCLLLKINVSIIYVIIFEIYKFWNLNILHVGKRYFFEFVNNQLISVTVEKAKFK